MKKVFAIAIVFTLTGCATNDLGRYKANVLGLTTEGEIPVKYIDAKAPATLKLHPPTIDTIGFSEKDAAAFLKWVASRPAWIRDSLVGLKDKVNQ